jgi:hypothetical protein
VTDPVKIALIATTPPTILAMSSAILGWLNRKKLVEVDRNIDGKLTGFIDEVRKAEFAKGVKQEHDRLK